MCMKRKCAYNVKSDVRTPKRENKPAIVQEDVCWLICVECENEGSSEQTSKQ